MGDIPEDFYADQTVCGWCRQPTVRVGLPRVDAMRSGGKEPVLCGGCLVSVKERLERGQESEDLLREASEDSNQ